MKRIILIGLLLLAAIVTVTQAGIPETVIAQADPTRGFGIHWDRYAGPLAVGKPELIMLYIDLEIRCNGTVVISQTLDLNGPAPELSEGLFREFDWDWGEWTPPNVTCTEWQRIRWEVPEEAGAYDINKGEMFAGQVFGEYWAPEGKETQEDDDHFWLLGPLADDEPTATPTLTATPTPTWTPTPAGEWYDSCPGAPDCETPGPTPTDRPTLTPQPTLTPRSTDVPRPTDTPGPEPTCRLTPTCPSSWPTQPPWPTEPPYPTATHYPTATAYPTSTPWPTQPPL